MSGAEEPRFDGELGNDRDDDAAEYDEGRDDLKSDFTDTELAKFALEDAEYERRMAVEHEANARDRALAWELYEAQPHHPRIAELTQRSLVNTPAATGMIILLALHRQACGEVDEARRLLQDLVGRRDAQFLNAVKNLRDLKQSSRNYAESMRLTEIVLREDPEADWTEWMDYGTAEVFVTDPEQGWQRIDDAVEMAARDDPDWYADALAQRALKFLTTGAPPDRFLPAAEAAIAADPSDQTLSLSLAYAYLFDYRPEQAEQLLLRVLREDPTNAAARGAMTATRGFLDPIERGDVTINTLREIGIGEVVWRIWRDQMFGTGLGSALEALDEVLAEPMRASLRPPLDAEAAGESYGDSELLAWHDGQDPGTGADARLDGAFRLMTSAEIDEMEHAIERDPESWPQWDTENEYFSLIATDDAGAYLFEGTAGRAYERAVGREDRLIAPSLADWVWDRVASLGGRDRRPGRS